jgi:hypothetical protein
LAADEAAGMFVVPPRRQRHNADSTGLDFKVEPMRKLSSPSFLCSWENFAGAAGTDGSCVVAYGTVETWLGDFFIDYHGAPVAAVAIFTDTLELMIDGSKKSHHTHNWRSRSDDFHSRSRCDVGG